MSSFWSDIIGRLGASADTPSDTSRGIMAGNPLAVLPNESAEKLERLRDAQAAARAVLLSKSDALMALREQHGRAQSEAQQALANLPPPPRGTTEAELKARVEADGARFRGALDKAIAAHQRASEALDAYAYLGRVEDWLRRFQALGGSLAHHPLPAPKSKVQAGLAQEVAELRKQIAAVDDAWRSVEGAAAPKADFLERAKQEVEALAEHGRLVINLSERGPAPLNLRSRLAPMLNRMVFPPLVPNGPPDVHYALNGSDEAAAFTAWLFRDVLLAKVTEAIDAADDAGALDHVSREKKFGQLAAQKLELERAEESAIVAAAKTGHTIPRRPNCDPRAVLEIREV